MKNIKNLKYIAFILILLISSPVSAATISFSNVTEGTYSQTGDTYKRVTINYSFANANESSIVMRRTYTSGEVGTTGLASNNSTGTNSSQKIFTFNTSGQYSISKVDFFVRTKDNRLAPLTTYNIGGDPPLETTKNPPSMSATKNNDGISINFGQSGLNYQVTDDNGDSVYFTDEGNGKIYIPLANSSSNSQYDFTWEFFDGHHIRYDYSGSMENVESRAQLGTMEFGQFHPLTYYKDEYNGRGPFETTYEPNAPDGGYYMKIDLLDADTGDTLESHMFDTNGEVGEGTTNPFPYTVTTTDSDGNTFKWTVNEDGSHVPTDAETLSEDPPEDPGDTGGTTPPPSGDTGGTDTGGQTGTNCIGCDLLACPGWDQIADKIGSAVAGKLPPPPNWQEVAKVFGDEFVPRIGNEIENKLGHPDPPPTVSTPPPPTFDGTSGVDIPQAVDQTPPAQQTTFDTVPDIQVEQDQTGGIDLSKSDPIESIPHSSEDHMPIPGQETGGFKPQTKTSDIPKPSNSGPVQPPADSIPKPNTSTSEPPVPDSTTSDPPKPEMPMPEG